MFAFLNILNSLNSEEVIPFRVIGDVGNNRKIQGYTADLHQIVFWFGNFTPQ